MTLKDKLRLIAEGYYAGHYDDHIILITNPDYRPDDGSDPFISIDVDTLVMVEECK